MRNGDDDSLRWEEESREKESSFGIFDVYRVSRVSPAGHRANFVVVDAPDWVTVIPVITNRSGEECFLLARQYRHGSRSVTLEFPAGVIEPDEEPSEAAARELLEETGYSAGELVLLGSTNPNPAFMCNTTYTFVATNLRRVQKQSLDANEVVEIETVPIERVTAEMGTGDYNNAIMMSALAFFLRWRATGQGALASG